MEQTRKLPSTAFKKGQSGNPGGRKKRTGEELELIEACKEKSMEALDTIYSIMREGQSEKVRLSAATTIIERAYGKPKQEQDVTLVGELAQNIVMNIGFGK